MFGGGVKLISVAGLAGSAVGGCVCSWFVTSWCWGLAGWAGLGKKVFFFASGDEMDVDGWGSAYSPPSPFQPASSAQGGQDFSIVRQGAGATDWTRILACRVPVLCIAEGVPLTHTHTHREKKK